MENNNLLAQDLCDNGTGSYTYKKAFTWIDYVLISRSAHKKFSAEIVDDKSNRGDHHLILVKTHLEENTVTNRDQTKPMVINSKKLSDPEFKEKVRE